VEYGSRIALIGRNGSGKSTLLGILRGTEKPTSGNVKIPANVTCGYVPQIVETSDSLSGGQRFQRALTGELRANPNLLLLDEPTNHLDSWNRKSLTRMLLSYHGTLIVASHDVEFLRNCINVLWHIDSEKISVFSGKYDDYIDEINIKRSAVEREIAQLEWQKNKMHTILMREQQRVARSKAIGKKKVERRKWLPAVGDNKANGAEKAAGRKKAAIDERKQILTDKLSTLQTPEIILPKFSLSTSSSGNCTILSVVDGTAGYGGEPLLVGINFSMQHNGKLAIVGRNGSGKSTLAKAIMGIGNVVTSGNWRTPPTSEIGYLDQHYNTLDANNSAVEAITKIVPDWSQQEIRNHLASFLFRKNLEVNCQISQLSGGEKARLSLAVIAARPPKLLILDEVTNNLDVETKDHVTGILRCFPGAIIVISHDNDFLDKIGINDSFHV
jgi:ATPase subunit of ABC transporter with duplicated ATPase domains